MTEAYNYSHEVLGKLAGVLVTDTQTERITSLRDLAKTYVEFISKERVDAVPATEEILKTFEKKGFLGVKKYSLVTGEGTFSPCIDGEVQNPHTAQVLEAYEKLQDSFREEDEKRFILAKTIVENPDFSDLTIILHRAQQKGARKAISEKEAQKAYFPNPEAVFPGKNDPSKQKPAIQRTPEGGSIRGKIWYDTVDGRR